MGKQAASGERWLTRAHKALAHTTGTHTHTHKRKRRSSRTIITRRVEGAGRREDKGRAGCVVKENKRCYGRWKEGMGRKRDLGDLDKERVWWLMEIEQVGPGESELSGRPT